MMQLTNIEKDGTDFYGKVAIRQSTYTVVQDLESGDDIRIDFLKKQEFRISADGFSGIHLYDVHPLLYSHEFSFSNIYVTSSPKNPTAVSTSIGAEISKFTRGWRSIEDYCNTEYGVETILKEGSGLLYEGPPNIAESIKKLLSANGIRYSSTYIGELNGEQYKVLLLGESFIVAQDFRFSVDESP